jgi:PAS domain S-box-containing protein
LFNPGAERIFAYDAVEVIGKLPVWKLYPAGVARQIMQMLRSTAHGGIGRLAQAQLDVRTGQGDLVPVSMTASIIYEGGREAATVGILSDLRERLQMEERLLHVQEQLEIQERQAMVAQLAGATAHELNQPLTSILGYAQLIERQSEPDAPHARALQIILREIHRMSDIVRKIGRITRHEVKQYVGSASIMDLDKSAASGNDLRIQRLEDTGEISGLAPDPEGEPPAELGDESYDGVVEPVEEEITAQHLIVARAAGAAAGDEDEEAGGDEADGADEEETVAARGPTAPSVDQEPPTRRTTEFQAPATETPEPATDRISRKDAVPKR